MFDFLKRNNKKETSTETRSAAGWKSLFGGITGDVTGNGAYRLVPVYSCIRLLADSVAMTDIKIYTKDKDDNRSLASTHPLNKVLVEPQENKTFYNWAQDIVGQLQGFGNAYAVISRNKDYTVKELIFVPTQNVIITRLTNGEYYYKISLPNSTKSIDVWYEDILHFRNMSLDGISGISPISQHQHTLERAYGESDYSKSFYDNAANIGGVVKHPSKLSKEAIEQIKTAFSDAYGGTSNAGKTAVLAEGMSYEQFKLVSPADAEYIQSKKLTDSDIANIFRVPVVLLNSTEASTYANVENLNVYFQMYSLSPIYKCMVQQMNLKLISPSKQGKVYFEFDPESLLTATSKQKMEALDRGIKGSFLTPNEARRKLNLNPIDGLDDVFIPLNMTPSDKFDDVMMDGGAESQKPNVSSDDSEDRNLESLEKRYNKLATEFGRIKKKLDNI